MLPKINPTNTAAWRSLQDHFSEMKNVHMRELFQHDPHRFSKYSLSNRDIVFDHSKNIINDKTIQLLLQLADECKLKDGIDAMFNGEKINETEGRAVLHTALRNLSSEPFFAEGIDVMPEVRKVLKHMKNFCNRVHDGRWRGYTGKRIKNIVNIGIGGSDLGPLMVTEALKPYWWKNRVTKSFHHLLVRAKSY